MLFALIVNPKEILATPLEPIRTHQRSLLLHPVVLNDRKRRMVIDGGDVAPLFVLLSLT